MGNLLGLRESFHWEDNTLDRNNFIDNLNFAIVEARKFNDEIYGSPSFSDFDPYWGDFMAFIYQAMFDEQVRINRFPWLNQLQHTTLVRIFEFFQTRTPNLANNLNDLRTEFPNSNNENIGCYYDNIPARAVHNSSTWNEFHRTFVSSFTWKQRQHNYNYFIKFYKHGLVIPLNQIQTRINQGLANTTIADIHQALIPHEQIHVHFHSNTNTALNIDGTWKHENASFTIPQEACEQLSDWGFLLPIEYYNH